MSGKRRQSPTLPWALSGRQRAGLLQKHADRRDKLAEGLAAELGVSKEKVLAALDKVETQLESDARTERLAGLKERLDAAVADGKLTREQADAIIKAAEAGVILGGPHGPGGHGWPGPPR